MFPTPVSLDTLRRLLLLILVGLCAGVIWVTTSQVRQLQMTLASFAEESLALSTKLSRMDRTLVESRNLALAELEAHEEAPDAALTLVDTILERVRGIATSNNATNPIANAWTTDVQDTLLRIRTGVLQYLKLQEQDLFQDALRQTEDAILAQFDILQQRFEEPPEHSAQAQGALFLMRDDVARLQTLVRDLFAFKPAAPTVIGDQLNTLREDASTLRDYDVMVGLGDDAATLHSLLSTLAVNFARAWPVPGEAPNLPSTLEDRQALLALWEQAEVTLQTLHEDTLASLDAKRHVLTAAMADTLYQMLLFLLAGVVASGLAILLLQRILENRLRHLERATATLAKGNLAYRIAPGPNDILGALAKGFNTMAASLQEKDMALQATMLELQASHSELEARVEKRTEQLSSAMHGLRLKDSVFMHTQEGILITNHTFAIQDANPAMTSLFGYTLDELLHQQPLLFNSPLQDLQLYDDVEASLHRQGHWDGELWQRTKDGRDILIWLFTTALKDDAGEITHVVGIYRDMTEHHNAQAQIVKQAKTDFLTGLPNRAALMETLGEAIYRARKSHTLLSVLFLDLDNFKHINDSLGHPAGDSLLKQVAGRLQQCVRDEDTVARLGGDEFVILATHLHSQKEAEHLAGRVLDAFRDPYAIEDSVLHANTSIGITMYPEDATDADTLLRNADLALYKAKAQGKGQMYCYTEQLNDVVQERLALERSLHQAIEQREFEIWYQPVLLLQRPTVVGAEALIRWRRGNELLAPATFIPLAEEMNCIGDITEQVLDTLAADLRRWRDAHGLSLHVSMNISGAQFVNSTFPDYITRIMAGHGLHPGDVGLEIAETAIMGNPDAAIDTCQALRDAGFSIAVDNFGTGQSSLRYLQQFPVSALKIDRQFIWDLERKGSQNIVRATIAMAKGLGLIVHGEGVETPWQLQFLRENGCDFCQGYFFSKPLLAKDFLAYCQHDSSHRAIAGDGSL